MKFFTKYLATSFVVFLHLSPQIKTLTVESNRSKVLWGLQNELALLTCILIVPLGIRCLAELVDRLADKLDQPRISILKDHLFLLAFFSGSLATLSSYLSLYDRPNLTTIIWCGVMAIVGYSLGSPRSRLVGLSSGLCLVGSPIVLIVALQILTWSHWDVSKTEDFEKRPASDQHAPVFVFMFEEWSYARSTEDDEFLPFFTNLKTFSENATVFTRAQSPFSLTEISVPRFLFQTDENLVVQDGKKFWEADGDLRDSAECESLFSLARSHGYNTHMVGWFNPYYLLLGDSVDYCRSFTYALRGDNFLHELYLMGVVRNAALDLPFWTDPITHRFFPVLRRKAFGQNWMKRDAEILDEMDRVIANGQRNSFGVFHLTPAHSPHIQNEDGSYRNWGNSAPQNETGYLRSLRYLDFCVGRIIERLEAVGLLDSALVIITADHGWRMDPAAKGDAESRVRVPLVIKLPNQKAGRRIELPVATNHLEPLFQSVFSGVQDPESLHEIVDQIASAQADE